MTDRPNPEWWPENLVDEVMPEGKAAPEDWVEDGHLVTPGSDGDGNDIERRHKLADGERVKFFRCAEHGRAVVTVASGGTAHCEAEMPAGADQCCIMEGWQMETSSGSVLETLQLLQDCDPEPDEYIICFFEWEDFDLQWNEGLGVFTNPAAMQ